MRANQPWTRREMLRVGGLALGGLGLADVLSAQTQPKRKVNKAVILIYCVGGASQLETYDLKPDAPEQIRSVFRPIATCVPSINLCEHLPLHAKLADKFTLIRSMSHKINIHNDGSIFTLTGKEPSVPDPTSTAKSEHPDFGMITSHWRARFGSAIPQYVSIPNIFPFTRPRYLGSGTSAFATGDPSLPGWSLPQFSLVNQTVETLEHRRQLLQQFDQLRTQRVSSLDPFREQAFDILTNSGVARAFDLQQESIKLRDRYGRHLWGQACLLARRLAEAGTGVITVVSNTPKVGPEFPSSSGGLQGSF